MPERELDDARMAALGRILEARMGWSLAGSTPSQLDHALRGMARHMGLAGAGACLEWLVSGEWSGDKADSCARFMTVGETYFFREQRAFDLIVGCARARADDPAGAGTPLRVWSAGCCTGEEPYSAAMALLEAIPGLAPGAVSILATDISKRSLEAARTGSYRAWSFRGVPERIRERYFSAHGDGLWRIRDQVRAMVHFEELNLALPAYPSPANGTAGIDVILCRNVLMYFTPAQRKLAVQRLRACLADGGWLVVNASEASSELFEGFTATCHPDAIHYRKSAPAALQGARTAAPPKAPAALKAPQRLKPPAPVAHAGAAARPARRAMPATPERAGPDAPAAEADTIAHLRALVTHSISAGDIERARASLQRIIFLQPLDVAAHYMMGMVLEQAGRKRQGRRKFEVVAQLLEGVDDAQCVPGTDGLPAGYLRASLRTRLASEATL